jgi:hypothetical protein
MERKHKNNVFHFKRVLTAWVILLTYLRTLTNYCPLSQQLFPQVHLREIVIEGTRNFIIVLDSPQLVKKLFYHTIVKPRNKVELLDFDCKVVIYAGG